MNVREAESAVSLGHLLDHPPFGVTVRVGEDGTIVIHVGAGSFYTAQLFLYTGLFIMTFGLIQESIELINGRPAELWFWGLAMPLMIAWQIASAVMAFSRRSFRLSTADLLRTTQFLWFRREKWIPRESVTRITHGFDSDSAERADCYWLSVDAPKGMTLIRSHTYAATYWLGDVLSDWSGAHFEPAKPPEKPWKSRKQRHLEKRI